MEEFVLSFGMVVVVVVDKYSRFIGAFEAMFKCLQIILWYLARGNHKVNIIEKITSSQRKYKLLQENIVLAMMYLSKTQKHLSMHGTASQYMLPT